MTKSEYYNTYIYNLLMDCYIELETAWGRGNKVEHKKYPRPDPPEWVLPIISTDFKKEFEKDQRRWSFLRMGYYSLLHCELFYVTMSIAINDECINPEYIKLLNSYEASYKELQKQEKQCDRIIEDDGEDEVEQTNKELKEYIESAKKDIESIKKDGYCVPYISGYCKYASSMHCYLAETRNNLSRRKFQLWSKLDYWVVADLDSIIFQYENILNTYPDNYDERIIRW